jgi:hypothetical protein
MKRIRLKIWKITIIILLTIACEKQSEKGFGTITVYTTSSQNWSVIIDGREYGKVKKASQMPVCSDPAFMNISLSAGDHKFVAKSLDGYAWDAKKYKTVRVIADECKQVSIP